MITIVPAATPYVLDTATFDLLTDDRDYLNERLCPPCDDPFAEEWLPIQLGFIAPNPFEAVRLLDIDAGMLRAAADYHCPYLRHNFSSVVPVMLYTKNKHGYAVFNERPWYFDDADLRLNYRRMPIPDRFGSAMIGPGFTSGFRPSDGSSELKTAEMGLSNGDRLLVVVWHWFNK